MFAKIFAFVFVVAYAAAEIPSYIHVCGRRDPKIEQCILNNINNLKSKICKGIPELDVPSSDPFIVDKLVLTETPEIKLYIKDAQLTHLCEFTINRFRADIDNLHFDVEFVFDQIRVNATYDFGMHVLVPIRHTGHVYFITDNVGAKINCDFKIVTKGGKRYIYLSQIKTNLDFKDYETYYDVDNEKLRQLNEIIRNFLGQNKEEIIKNFTPLLEEAASKQILSISNDVVKHFTYEELLPDRT